MRDCVRVLRGRSAKRLCGLIDGSKAARRTRVRRGAFVPYGLLLIRGCKKASTRFAKFLMRVQKPHLKTTFPTFSVLKGAACRVSLRLIERNQFGK